jgi:hypothetical protein
MNVSEFYKAIKSASTGGDANLRIVGADGKELQLDEVTTDTDHRNGCVVKLKPYVSEAKAATPPAQTTGTGKTGEKTTTEK